MCAGACGEWLKEHKVSIQLAEVYKRVQCHELIIYKLLREKLALERCNFSHDFDQKPAGVRCMGGPGSGNWYRWSKRTTLDDVKPLDVRRLHRQGALQPWVRATVTWHRGEHETGAVRVAMVNGHLVVEYRARWRGHEDWEDVRQVIALDWTPCHSGDSGRGSGVQAVSGV